MNLLLSGIALSYQQIPSCAYFEEGLAAQREVAPVMVEHPGEVILSALQDLPAAGWTGLTIIPSSIPPEYGYYLTLLEERFGELEVIQPESPALIDLIHQAASILEKDPSQLVVINETTQTGSAAITLTQEDQSSPGIIKLHIPEHASFTPLDFELLGFAGAGDGLPLDLMAALISNRSAGRPVSLAHPGSHGQPDQSLLNLILLALAIKVKTLPAWTHPGDWDNPPGLISNLHLNTASRPWLSTNKDFLRSAALLGKSARSATWQAIFLSEIPQTAETLRIRPIQAVDPSLFLVRAANQEGLIKGLESLETALKGQASLTALAQNAYAQYSGSADGFTCTILALTREGLQKEIIHAKAGVEQALRTGLAWSSPAGSYFAPHHFEKQTISFVYPGAFNVYPGMAKDLFFNFPGLQDAALEIIPDLSHFLAEDILQYPPTPGLNGSQPAEDIFAAQPAKLIESGIGLSVLYTLILEKVFGLIPAAAFGYSLGEYSMLWAYQVWQNPRETSAAWNSSPLFKNLLVGKMDLVRHFWQDQELSKDFWGSFILKDSAERVAAACAEEPLATATIQNTPDEIVIAGEKGACSRVIQALGCHALPMPFNAAIHHPAVGASQELFRELFSNATNPREDIRFYSAANYQQLILSRDNLASAMAQMTSSPFDFPRLVNQVYQDGSRIFIELGPQSTCSRWIKTILKGKPHAVVPINKRFQGDLQGILKVISLLLSYGIDLDLAALFPKPKRSNAGSVPAGLPRSQRPEQQLRSLERESAQVLQPGQSLAMVKNLDRISADLAKSHGEYLVLQATQTKVLARVMELNAGVEKSATPPKQPVAKVLYNHDQIQAFTNGDHRICFGDQFTAFGSRRFPRLPNGPLQFIDRVMHIEGEPGLPLPGAFLVSEVDLRQDAWYRDGHSAFLPHVAIMEIALQPCGFLSAYLGSIQGRENQDIYFRNLNGEGSLLFWPNQDEPIVSNHVELISSSSLDEIIIQKYNFQLSQGGSPFFQGTSTFGYFPQSMLAEQAGLNGTPPSQSWFEGNPDLGSWRDVDGHGQSQPAGSAHLPHINTLWIAPQGGKHKRGYLYLADDLPENAWFYQAHFYQDPVMPGSLGVETMARSLMVAAPYWHVPRGLSWRIKSGSRFYWKYRGQITPETSKLSIDLHLKSITRAATGWEICADGYLWKDARRIYQVEDLCLESLPPV